MPSAIKHLDEALLEMGLQPRLVPESVKLTTLKPLGEGGENRTRASDAAAAEPLSYCLLGAQDFTEHNGPSLTEAMAMRLV